MQYFLNPFKLISYVHVRIDRYIKSKHKVLSGKASLFTLLLLIHTSVHTWCKDCGLKTALPLHVFSRAGLSSSEHDEVPPGLPGMSPSHGS